MATLRGRPNRAQVQHTQLIHTRTQRRDTADQEYTGGRDRMARLMRDRKERYTWIRQDPHVVHTQSHESRKEGDSKACVARLVAPPFMLGAAPRAHRGSPPRVEFSAPSSASAAGTSSGSWTAWCTVRPHRDCTPSSSRRRAECQRFRRTAGRLRVAVLPQVLWRRPRYAAGGACLWWPRKMRALSISGGLIHRLCRHITLTLRGECGSQVQGEHPLSRFSSSPHRRAFYH